MEGNDATGMSHTVWREYENLSAKWTAPDPYGGSMSLASPQSFNRYAYVNNDPVNKVDPVGLLPASEGWSGVQNAWGGDPGFFDPHFGGPGIISDRMAEYDDLVQTRHDGILAQHYLNEGNGKAAARLMDANSGVGLYIAGHVMWGGEAASFVKGEVGMFLLRQQMCSVNATMVIVWGKPDTWLTNPDSYEGHVSYITMQDDKSYSWQGIMDWTKDTPSSDYTNERSKYTAGVGYILDFGPELNDKFQNALIHAYDRTFLGGKHIYDPVIDNCGEAFDVAINAISKDIGVPTTHAVLPSKIKEYIK